MVDLEAGIFIQGFGIVWNSPTIDGNVVFRPADFQPGRKSYEVLQNYFITNPILRFKHGSTAIGDRIIGRVVTHAVVPYGLYLKAFLWNPLRAAYPDTDLVNIYEGVKTGRYRSFSPAIVTTPECFKTGQIESLSALDEISICEEGRQPLAKFALSTEISVHSAHALAQEIYQRRKSIWEQERAREAEFNHQAQKLFAFLDEYKRDKALSW